MSARARRILVAYDGSEAGERALDAAADLVGYGSTLAVVTDGAASGVRARDRLRSRCVDARYHERAGEPGDAVVREAEKVGADLIVVGGRRRLGVLGRAPCDVLLVR